MLTHTPRSPEPVGSSAIIAAAASRSTLKVPTRLTSITFSNGVEPWAPRRPATRSAQPMPAQQTEIRSPPGCAAATSHRPCDGVRVGDVGA